MSEDIPQNDNSQSESSNSNANATDLSSELSKISELAEKYKNDFLYLRAEFDNYKRHAIKERSEMKKYEGERLILELLEVMDNFERALTVQLNSENLETFQKGVAMTAQALKSVLEKNGISEINSQGAPFDPSIHEALSSEPTTDVAAGCVYRVFRKPYKYHEKVIRPGQVVVAKKPE